MKKILFIFLLAVSIKIDAAILLVNPNGTGGVRLTSVSSTDWNTKSFSSLQTAIDSSQSGDEIWVKAGTYHPSRNPYITTVVTNDIRGVFLLKSNVQLYGGFAGNETTRNSRNVTQNITKLSADYANNDTPSITNSFNFGRQLKNSNNTENAVHCVLIPARINVVLDGFSIEGGTASLSLIDSIDGVRVDHKYGGGIYIVNSQRVTIANCKFRANLKTIRLENSDSINLTNNTYTLNTSTIQNNETNRLHLTNELFYENFYTAYDSRVLPNQYGSISNSKFEYNIVGEPGLIYFKEGFLDIKNSLFKSQGRANLVQYPDIINNSEGGTLSVDSCMFFDNDTYFGSCITSNNIELKNSVFRNNIGDDKLGTTVAIASNGNVRNCVFDNNTGIGNSSAIHFSSLRGTITNSVFKNSRLTIRFADLLIINSTFLSTTSSNLLSRDNSNDTFTIVNSILWKKNTSSFPISYTSSTSKNFQITNSNVSGPTILPGTGNYSSYPDFIDTSKTYIFGEDSLYFTEDDNLALKLTSPSINSGINLSYPSKDILNKPRTIGCKTDHGAYENALYFAGKDTSICLGSQIKIGIDSLPNYTYQWSGSNFVGNSNNANPNISPNTIGIKTYIVTATYVPTGCVNIDTVLIDVVSPPNIFAGNDSILCLGDSIKLNATTSNTSFDSIIWNINNFSNNQYIKPNNSSQYISKVYFKKCYNQDTINITINNPPNILTQPISSIECRNSNKLLITKSNNSSDSFIWYRNNSLIPNSNNDTILISNIDTSKTGTYKVGIINKCGSTLSNSANLSLRDSININPINFTIDTICSKAVFNKTIIATGYNLTYQWRKNNNTISGANSSSYLNNNVSIGDTGLYSIQVNDGCNFSKTVAICSLKVLNTISPTVSINTNSLVICDENNITINFTSNNIGSSPSIKWLVNNVQVSTQFQNYNYKPINGDKIQVSITTTERCSSPRTVLSNILTIGVSKPSRDTTYKSLCDNESFSFGGNTYNSAGFYTVSLKNKIGCDSIKDLILTKTLLNNTVNSSNGILSSLENGAFYQWYDCNGNSKLNNETKQTYKPNKTGSYKVQIKKNNCTIESLCKTIQVNNSSILSNEIENINFYPNPTKNKLFINNSNSDPFYVSIYDISGKEIILYLKNPKEIDMSTFTNGIYNFTVYNKDLNTLSTFKILKE